MLAGCVGKGLRSGWRQCQGNGERVTPKFRKPVIDDGFPFAERPSADEDAAKVADLHRVRCTSAGPCAGDLSVEKLGLCRRLPQRGQCEQLLLWWFPASSMFKPSGKGLRGVKRGLNMIKVGLLTDNLIEPAFHIRT